MVMVVVLVVMMVMMVMMVLILVMVVMMMIVDELHVWVGARLVMATCGGHGRVGDPQKRACIGYRIKQFAE